MTLAVERTTTEVLTKVESDQRTCLMQKMVPMFCISVHSFIHLVSTLFVAEHEERVANPAFVVQK